MVLDTQVVLDWLVFRDPSCCELGRTLIQARLIWCATPNMYEELMHVLERGVGAAWHPDLAMIAETFDRYAHIVSPEPPCAKHLMRCTDPDDQMFLDLALAVKARWLLSRDRAVLALARRARGHGVDVLTPQNWRKLAPIQ